MFIKSVCECGCMSMKLEVIKKRASIIDTMTLPTSSSQKERYKRLQNELEKRGFESLHTLTRERIDVLLDEVEALLSHAG